VKGLKSILIGVTLCLANQGEVAQATRLFVSQSSTNVSLTNPVIVVEPGTTQTFYLYYQPTDGNQVSGIGHDIVSSNPIISRTNYVIDNPTIAGSARWGSAGFSPGKSSFGPATFVVDDGNSLKIGCIFGTQGATDPLFDAATGTYRFATFTYTADQVGTTEIRLGVGSQGFALNPNFDPQHKVNFGFGDAAVSGASFGATSLKPDAFVTVMQRDVLHPWHNTIANKNVDVNADGLITPLDALLVIDALNLKGAGTGLPVPPIPPDTSPPFIDVTGDNLISPDDALGVIDYLNTHPETSSFSLSAMNAFANSDYGMALTVPEPSTLALTFPAAATFLLLLARRRYRGAA